MLRFYSKRISSRVEHPLKVKFTCTLYSFCCLFVLAEANKHLYALRVFMKCGVACQDLVQVYCSLVRSVIEYAAPVWADLLAFRSKTLEMIQKKTFKIIFLGLPYDVGLSRAGLLPLGQRWENSCQKLMKNFRDKGFLSNIIPIPPENPPRVYSSLWLCC